MALLWLLLGLLPLPSASQQVGSVFKDSHPTLAMYECTNTGPCLPVGASLTLEANFRWSHHAEKGVHDGCLKNGEWDADLCPDPEQCAQRCAVDGVEEKTLESMYGIHRVDNGFELRFGTEGPNGEENRGARAVIMSGSDSYKIFKLKNREFSFDVDISDLPCGVLSDLKFVAMPGDGDKGLAGNAAGAKYGLGYCDGTCPRDQKFVQGKANTKAWSASEGRGSTGSCCPEVDVWQANRETATFAVHPCTSSEAVRCEGALCETACDVDGCQFNPVSMGDHTFFGPGKKVDTKKPITVVTQFLTTDGTESGELHEIRRYYVQGSHTYPNPNADVPGSAQVRGNSLTDGFCQAEKMAFNSTTYPVEAGYLKQLGKALEKGTVLVLSLLDARSRPLGPAAGGKCEEDPADGLTNRSVRFSNFMYGDIGSTCSDCTGVPEDRRGREAVLLEATTTPQPTSPPKPLLHQPIFVTMITLLTLGVLAAVGFTGVQQAQKQGWQMRTEGRAGTNRPLL